MSHYSQEKAPEQVQTQQPGYTAPMSAGGNRNALNKPIDPSGQREWSHGICGCFGACGTCCLAHFCPCMVFSKNKSRLDYLNRNGQPDPNGGEVCTADCALYTALLLTIGFGWVLQIGPRQEVRNRYSIVGSSSGDILASWCCMPCALTQESREIELEENSFRA